MPVVAQFGQPARVGAGEGVRGRIFGSRLVAAAGSGWGVTSWGLVRAAPGGSVRAGEGGYCGVWSASPDKCNRIGAEVRAESRSRTAPDAQPGTLLAIVYRPEGEPPVPDRD